MPKLKQICQSTLNIFMTHRHVKYLRDNSLLVAHGTKDRHVHVSHTWALTQALVEAGILFRQMIYPNTSLSEPGAREHLHHTLEKYFKDVRQDNITL